MKINFENTNNNQNVDNSKKTSQSNPSKAGGLYNYNRMGFKIDISGTVMDNKAYGGHGKTAEDVMMDASRRNIEIERNYMAVMSNSMSGADFAKLQKDGYRVGQTDIETVVTIVDKIKATMAESGQVVIGYNDDLSVEELRQITGNISLAVSISKSFEKHNVPVTKENVKGAAEAFAKAQQIPGLNDGAVKYMVTNRQAATIDHIYLAQYSSMPDSRTQAKGYFADDFAGYYGKKADDMDVEKLAAQIEKVINEAGLNADETTMNQAKWLVESGIPLTAEALTAVHGLKDIPFPMEPDAITDAIARAVSEGKKPQDALLIKGNDIYTQAAELVETVSKITDEAVEAVIEEGRAFTIRNCKLAMQYKEYRGRNEADGQNRNSEETQARMIRARRQLEEVRLQMTLEANVKLLKSGFSIDTAQISEVIERLRTLEANQNAKLFGAENTEEKEKTYNEALYKSQAIRRMPVDVVGKFAFLERKVTLDSVYEKGNALLKEYQKADRAYEQMMSTPRRDLGDSIQTAFRNIEFLLNDMGMEASEQNNRAVRILAYNQMPVNKESIAIIKNADERLRRVVEKMTPANTLYMVRDGVNPLNMDLEELYQYLNQIPQTKESDVEKFAKFIYKLNKKKEISQEEKEACIGIFRLLRQIEKGDGSAIGAVIDTNQSLSLMNLLNAVRTKRAGHVDKNVNDDFGMLTEVVTKGTLISEQVNNYYNKKLHHIYENLEPEKLLEMNLNGDMTVEELETEMADRAVDEELEQAYEREQLDEVRKVSKISDEAITAVLEGKVSKNTDYLLAADYLKSYRGVTMNRLKRLAKQTDRATNRAATGDIPLEKSLDESIRALYEDFNSRSEAQEGYENFIEAADNVLTETSMLAGTQEIDIKSIVMYSKQMQFLSDMAKEENYEVPITIGDEVTSVNLKIVHNKQETKKVSISLQTLELSMVWAEFYVETDGIKGLIASNSKDGLEQLKAYEQSIADEITERTGKPMDLQFVYSNKQDLKPEAVRGDTDETVNTNDLYQIAKGFLFAIKEGADSESKL